MHQLKSGIKRTISWNKYQSKVSIERQKQYLHYLIDQGFQEVNRFLKIMQLEQHTQDSFFLKVEIKDCNVVIDGQNFLISQLKII